MSDLSNASLSLAYLPVAVGLGALHALEPGHAKTLIAAYLIGTKGTRGDAVLLGTSAALAHSLVVAILAITAFVVGREAFAGEAMHWLQLGSGVLVILLGSWLLWRRWRRARALHHHHDHPHHNKGHDHHHDHSHHEHHHHYHGDHDHHHHHHDDHRDLDDDAHARAHAAAMPDYVQRGERPSTWQIIIFGGAGGLLPCPASITVMLLALSVGQVGLGLLAVACFSVGLAITMVGVGLLAVAGFNRLEGSGRLAWVSANAPMISAWAIVASGVVAVVIAYN